MAVTEGLLYGASLAEELDAELGDVRRTRRLQEVGQRLRARPGESFPDIFDQDEAQLEGFYRLVGNEQLGFEQVLSAHQQATRERARATGQVVVIHDTTDFSFPRHEGELREGLSALSKNRQGFFGHISLVASADGLRAPLGVLRIRPYVHRTQVAEDFGTFWDQFGYWSNESDRWVEAVRKTATALGDVPHVHLMDREGDIYNLLSALVTEQRRFVIRAAQDRNVRTEDEQLSSIFTALDQTQWIAERTVQLAPRSHNRVPFKSRNHPIRRSRTATLAFRARSLILRCPTKLAAHIKVEGELQINLVEAFEVDAPEGEEPVRWLLLTTEPIDSVEDVLQIVDLYRTRWLIEELFQAIKTGCAYEKRQLASAHSLLLALALILPVAWHMLLARYLSRRTPDAPATTVLSPVQLEVLRAAVTKVRLDTQPTVQQVLLAIARLGGHLPRNGLPGWKTLGRGFRRLLAYEHGWRLAHGEQFQPHSDQS